MAEGTISWTGMSGQKYNYWVYRIGTTFKDKPGNYIFAKVSTPGKWLPLYIGETDSLAERIPNHEKLPCVKRNGGTHIHVHISSSSETTRRTEESDLIAKWDPPCNKE